MIGGRLTSNRKKVVELTDDVIITVQDQTANEVADMLAQNMASTYDKIIRNMLVATSVQISCLNGVNGNAITELTTTDIEIAVDYLMGNNGKKMAPNIEGTNAFGKPAQSAELKPFLIDLECLAA